MNFNNNNKKILKQYDQKYREEYGKEFTSIKRSEAGDTYARCTDCNANISISHGGKNDIKRHLTTLIHKQNNKTRSSTSSLVSYFTKHEDTAVVNAETLFTGFLVEHNLPLSTSDHAGPLFKKMFKDSPTAQKYGCARTKTTAIVETLAMDDTEKLVQIMRTSPYSIATDASTDMASIKLFPVAVKVYDVNRGQVMSLLLSILESTEDGTGKNIFNLVNDELIRNSITWVNCMSVGADNAMVMQGLGKGMAGYIKRENPAVYMLGCPCHLIHLAAEKSANQLPIALQDTLVDIYYYLDKSSKRHQKHKSFQRLCGKDTRKILKHVSTRWLSLGNTLNCLLDQWEPLFEYFKSELSSHSKKTGKIPSNQTMLSEKSKEKPSARKSTNVSSNPKMSSEKSKEKLSSSNPSKSTLVSSYQKMPSEKSKEKPTTITSNASKSTPKSKDDLPDNCSSAKKRKSESSTSSTTEKKVKPNLDDTSKPIKAFKDVVPIEFNLTDYMFKQTQLAEKAKAKEKQKKEQLKEIKQPQCSYAITKCDRIVKFLKQKQNKLYCLFLQGVIPLFDGANIFLQKDEPLIHKLHSVLSKQYKDLLIRFVKPEIIVSSPPTEIDFDCTENQKLDEDIYIGTDARNYLESEKSDIDTVEFFKNVREYFVAGCKYILKKFPLEDDLLKHAEVADISKRIKKKFEDILYFTTRFSCLYTEEVNELESEFLNYQIAEFPEEVVTGRVDEAWSSISKVTDESGTFLYARLAKIMFGILVIYHSNADCERMFSIVTKNKTQYRSNLSTGLLSSLVVHKIYMSAYNQCCFQQSFDEDLLKKAKKATYNKLNK